MGGLPLVVWVTATSAGVPLATRCSGHISSGYEHTCAITATGSLQCWGSNDHGQLNVPPGYEWAMVSAGKFHTCGITTSATLLCWGRNKHHEAETLASHTWASVGAGSSFTCAVTTTGKLVCWGNNHYGEVDVPTGVFVSVSTGFGEHACALETSGAAACWGQGSDGQAATPGDVEWTAIAPGWLHTCGLATARRPGTNGSRVDAVGQIMCWGNNDFGQTSVPNILPAEGSHWVSVTSGHSFSCGVTDTGRLKCWGHLPFGAGNIPPGVRWSEVSAGYYHICGFSLDERVLCWGLDYDGQVEVPEGFVFSTACAKPAVPAEHKAGRGGCPERQIVGAGTGFRSRAAVVDECQRLQCGYYIWSQPGSEDRHAGKAWFCRDDFFDEATNGADWPTWEVGRIKVGCAEEEGDVRLSAYPRGEAYVFDGGEWTALCGDLSPETAGVICRQLGYDRAALTYTYWGPEFTPVALHRPECTGAEARVKDCPLAKGACDGHQNDVGMECVGGEAERRGGPDLVECGTAHVAHRAHKALGQAANSRVGGELTIMHDHHGRTVAPAELADVLGFESDDRLRAETDAAAAVHAAARLASAGAAAVLAVLAMGAARATWLAAGALAAAAAARRPPPAAAVVMV